MGGEENSRPGALWAGASVGLAVLAVLVWGGYVAGWQWTGLSGDVKLWDWLVALALPVTVGVVPLLLGHRRRLHRRHRRAALLVLAGFAVLVLAGYLVPLGWTGFTGNTLWDWLELALLPVVIATSTLWRLPARWTRRHGVLAASGLLVAAVLVVAGYVVPWSWTGFTGNTAWDWVKLLLLPILLPTLVLPRLVDTAEAWMNRQRPPAPAVRRPAHRA
jgi:Kef-type K+ transport system membrane component KefB